MFIRLDELVRIIRLSSTVLVMPAVFVGTTGDEEVGPFEREFRIMRRVLPAVVFNVTTMKYLAFAIGAAQSDNEKLLIIRSIIDNLLALYGLEAESDCFLILSAEIIPRLGIPIVVIQTGGSLHGGAVELMHDRFIPKAVIFDA